MDMSYTSYLIPAAYAIYGLIFLFRTPDYLGRNGIGTKQSRRNEKTWAYAHRVMGIYCIAAAVLTGALAYWQNRIGDGQTLPTAFWVRMVIEIGTIAAALPVMNALTLRKFPADETETKEK